MGFAAGSTNLYQYVGNNPPNALDPLGLQPEPNPVILPYDPVEADRHRQELIDSQSFYNRAVQVPLELALVAKLVALRKSAEALTPFSLKVNELIVQRMDLGLEREKVFDLIMANRKQALSLAQQFESKAKARCLSPGDVGYTFLKRAYLNESQPLSDAYTKLILQHGRIGTQQEKIDRIIDTYLYDIRQLKKEVELISFQLALIRRGLSLTPSRQPLQPNNDILNFPELLVPLITPHSSR